MKTAFNVGVLTWALFANAIVLPAAQYPWPTQRVEINGEFKVTKVVPVQGPSIALSGTFSATAECQLGGTPQLKDQKLTQFTLSPNPLGNTFFSAENTLYTVDFRDNQVFALNIYDIYNGNSFGGGTGYTDLDLTFLPNDNFAVTHHLLPDGTRSTGLNVDRNITCKYVYHERLVNISSRSYVGPGDAAQIAGFIVTGTEPKNVLIRATGPSLAQYGVSGYLEDPKLEVYRGDVKIAENDDWSTETQNAATPIGWALKLGSKDAAIVTRLDPGAYTAVVSGKLGGAGVALVEVFELEERANRFTNISTRALVKPGGDALIGGFIVNGSGWKRVLIRASGPALKQYGVQSPLSDPVLTLYKSTGEKLNEVDDWNDFTKTAAGSIAWTFAPGSTDAATVMELGPGGYTAVVTGKGNDSGVALLEIFELPIN